MAFVAVSRAQDKKTGSPTVDFSGRWVTESIRSSSKLEGLPIPALSADFHLVITHLGDELRVKELSKRPGNPFRVAVYYLDGRGESNKGLDEETVYKSRSIVKGQKLMIESTFKHKLASRPARSEEEWELSKDGKKLTIRTTNFSDLEVRYIRGFRREQ